MFCTATIYDSVKSCTLALEVLQRTLLPYLDGHVYVRFQKNNASPHIARRIINFRRKSWS